jgi:ribosomal protein S18 acetylase RimI-like enzyme
MRNGIVDIRELSAHDLEPLLLAQTIEWRRKLDWDFSKSATLLRKLADAHTLSGAALFDCGEITAYGYLGLENGKGLIADVYPGSVLFTALLEALIQTPGVQRIEGQLMLQDSAPPNVTSYERRLMTLESEDGDAAASRVRLEPWNDQSCDVAATVIQQAYAGHIDSQINDHYRSVPAALIYLHNIEQFPGSATFHPQASYIAYNPAGNPAGIVLSSFVADEVAHIAEICVVPKSRGKGLGRELLHHAIAALQAAGAKRISLSVTSANEEAIRLYQRCGFREIRRFYAFVWEARSRSSTVRRNDTASG